VDSSWNLCFKSDYIAVGMENYINIDLANQLLHLKTNIIIFFNGHYEIKDLQVTIDDYEYISNFNVTTMYQKEVDIILGST
jgi:hypothetical protein